MVKPASWPYDAFGALVDRILKAAKLSQAGLAALVPMDQSQLSRWRTGKSRPKFESLVALGERLQAEHPDIGIGVTELLESAGYAAPAVDESEKPTRKSSLAEANAAGSDAVDRIIAARDRSIENMLREQAAEMHRRLDEQSAQIAEIKEYIRRMGGEGSSDQDIA